MSHREVESSGRQSSGQSYGRGNQNLAFKVYVGNLGDRPPRREQLEDEFSYYGPLRNVWVARSPPGFAYIEFESKRDAIDACRGLDGKNIGGQRIKVEMAKGSMKLRFILLLFKKLLLAAYLATNQLLATILAPFTCCISTKIYFLPNHFPTNLFFYQISPTE